MGGRGRYNHATLFPFEYEVEFLWFSIGIFAVPLRRNVLIDLHRITGGVMSWKSCVTICKVSFLRLLFCVVRPEHFICWGTGVFRDDCVPSVSFHLK